MTRWQPTLDWNTKAGRLLDNLLEVLPDDQCQLITVFGSAPLQMAYAPDYLSNDVDIFGDEILEKIVHDRKLDLPPRSPLVHVCADSSFQTGPNWQDRACVINRHGHDLRFPHPHDILIGKLARLEERDLAAFRLVIKYTRHPTEPELLVELQRAVDLYRPSFNEEKASAIGPNTVTLWSELFGKTIDVQKEIIEPALKKRQSDYHLTKPGRKQMVIDALKKKRSSPAGE